MYSIFLLAHAHAHAHVHACQNADAPPSPPDPTHLLTTRAGSRRSPGYPILSSPGPGPGPFGAQIYAQLLHRTPADLPSGVGVLVVVLAAVSGQIRFPSDRSVGGDDSRSGGAAVFDAVDEDVVHPPVALAALLWCVRIDKVGVEVESRHVEWHFGHVCEGAFVALSIRSRVALVGGAGSAICDDAVSSRANQDRQRRRRR